MEALRRTTQTRDHHSYSVDLHEDEATILERERKRGAEEGERRTDEDDELEDYGSGTDFARVLNPNDGIRVDFSNPLCPKFEFEEKEKERLMKPFRRTLIVKLLGRQLSYGFMVKKLRMLWERKGSVDVFDLENEFYLVNFQHHDDYMEALIGGPWVIADAYLNVARWSPEFNPKNAQITSVVAWVRLPDLPAPLFDKNFLLNLGNSIGKAIRLDIHTAKRARGKFARMCVELDITKPLIPEFNVEGKVLSVLYESLGRLCQNCGRVGHNKEGCAAFHQRNMDATMKVDGNKGKLDVTAEKEEEEGRWRTVQRTRRPRGFVSEVQGRQGGSRFSVLRDETGEEEELVGEDRDRQRAPIRRSTEKVQKDIFTGQQRKNVVGNNKDGGNRGLEKAGPSTIGHKLQESRKAKVEKGENVDPMTKHEVVAGYGKEEAKVSKSKEGRAETVLGMHRYRSVKITGKENIHPGEFAARMRKVDNMATGDIKLIGEEEDPIEAMEARMDVGCDTPELAD
ncbi:hypothetical protein K1719_043965 [Acacia pycnantha]|nr:hypothetical protein K1719_043965 [Acacia pycnantha]